MERSQYNVGHGPDMEKVSHEQNELTDIFRAIWHVKLVICGTVWI